MKHHPDVCVLGRIGYDLYAVEYNRPLARVEHFSRHLGGSSANTAVGMARLGLGVGIISCVGQDALADYLLEALRKEGVDTRFVRLVEGYNTSLCLTEISPPERFPQVFYRREPADSRLVVGSAELEYIQSAGMFVTNGTSLSGSPAREATFQALEAARKGGRRTVFDVDYRASSWPSPRAAALQAQAALPWVDIVLGNEDELSILTGRSSGEEQATALLEKGVELAIRKLGTKGVEAYTRDQCISAGSLPTNVVSTIGAGDGFAAGFLYGLVRGQRIEQCLRCGNAAAAIVVSRVSCSDAMPYLEELNNFLASTVGAKGRVPTV